MKTELVLKIQAVGVWHKTPRFLPGMLTNVGQMIYLKNKKGMHAC